MAIRKEDKKNAGERNPILGFVLLCLFIGAMWIVCTFSVYAIFDDWGTRGAVGDSFGAVNALFSGLAFAGMLYALLLQRRELKYQREEMLASRKVSESQLSEIKASRELLAQPLTMPSINGFKIERPRFFYSPPEDKHSAQSRYFVDVSVSNPTQFPALGINVSCFLTVGKNGNLFVSTDSFLSILPADSEVSEEGVAPDFMFALDESGVLFDSLRQHDPRMVPSLLVGIVFKNIVGAHFRLVQRFRVYASGDDVESLTDWHTSIVGFGARYKHEIEQMKELKRQRKDDDWGRLFQQIKGELAETASGPEHLELMVQPVPASFSLEQISKTEYEEALSSASYSQLVNALYGCPGEIDSRSN